MHCVGVAPLHGLPEIPESPVRSLDSGLLACEVSMEVLGQGFLAAYTEGDNSNVVATDTMKNVILRRALEHDGPTLEGFLDALGHALPRHLPGDGGPAAVGARAAVRAGPGRRARGAQRPALLARRRRPRGRRARARARRGRQRRARRAAQRPGRAAAAQDDRLGVHEVRARRRDDAARARGPAAVHPPRRALALRGSRGRARRATRPASSRRHRSATWSARSSTSSSRSRSSTSCTRWGSGCSTASGVLAEVSFDGQNHTHDPVPGSDAASGGRKAYTAAFPAWGLITLVLSR